MSLSSSSSGGAVAYGQGRTALLEAAIAVVAEGGLRRLTYRAVAERAGVTHGLVAHHFGTRDALIASALELAARRNIEASHLSPGSTSPDDLAGNLVEMALEDREAQAFQYELILEARRNPSLRPHVQTMLETYRRDARSALVELGLPDDEPLGDLVYAALDGMTFAIYSEDDPKRVNAALDRLRQILRFLIQQGWSPAGA